MDYTRQQTEAPQARIACWSTLAPNCKTLVKTQLKRRKPPKKPWPTADSRSITSLTTSKWKAHSEDRWRHAPSFKPLSANLDATRFCPPPNKARPKWAATADQQPLDGTKIRILSDFAWSDLHNSSLSVVNNSSIDGHLRLRNTSRIICNLAFRQEDLLLLYALVFHRVSSHKADPMLTQWHPTQATGRENGNKKMPWHCKVSQLSRAESHSIQTS